MEKTSVFLIDQNLLPFTFNVHESRSYRDTCAAIKSMMVRGAGAIGAASGFAMAQAFMSGADIKKAKKAIEATRPTAQNLFYSVQRVFDAAIKSNDPARAAVNEAQKIADEDAESCRNIGKYGSKLIKNGYRILTHCNAGWLAFVDHGSALAPIYKARDQGKKIFVYVDETRPRGQGAKLTAWELKNERIPFAVIADNAAAHIMSRSKVDMVIVGADRIAANGDVANKIGTLEKAIIAKEFKVPFYVAAPTSTFDLSCKNGKDIPIENRAEEEVLYQKGETKNGRIESILVCAPGSRALNPAFDVTPAKYISGIITEKGIIRPSANSIKSLINKKSA